MCCGACHPCASISEGSLHAACCCWFMLLHVLAWARPRAYTQMFRDLFRLSRVPSPAPMPLSLEPEQRSQRGVRGGLMAIRAYHQSRYSQLPWWPSRCWRSPATAPVHQQLPAGASSSCGESRGHVFLLSSGCHILVGCHTPGLCCSVLLSCGCLSHIFLRAFRAFSSRSALPLLHTCVANCMKCDPQLCDQLCDQL